MTRSRSFSLAVAALPSVLAWNQCAFPDVDWFALDEGVGISYAYAVAAMNTNMYSGGYTKGNFAFVGVTDTADVNPVAAATLWGDTTSNVQNLYVAEVNSAGSMTSAWHFKGSAIQQGAIGHGAQTNSINAHSGMHAMKDKAHLAVAGGFRQLLTLPDGTQWSSATRSNDKDQVPFVMKLDVSKTQGIGAGTTGWAKVYPDAPDYAGGGTLNSVDGDANGNMIVSFKGCTGYDATAAGTDAYGRPTVGAATGCTYHIASLAAADGSETWKITTPVGLYSCRVLDDGSFICGWSMATSQGTLSFGNDSGGNDVSVVAEAGKAGVVKFLSTGTPVWAKASASTSFSDLAASGDGTVLAVIGSTGGYGSTGEVARIDTSAGNEGNVLWKDAGGVGSHGLRGVEVAGTEVMVFGQVTGSTTLTDTTGSSMTLNSRGSYEVFVAAYDSSNGEGKWATDGGGTGMEYFFAFATDPDSHDVYVGGTSRSEKITWGDVTRNNVMYNGDPGQNNPVTSSAVGSSKAFVVKIKSTTSMPACLNTCNSAFPLQASDVKTGHCYIDRHCYADGDASPYAGHECTSCAAATNPVAWSAPSTTSHCVINNMCIASGAHKQNCGRYSCSDDPCFKCDPSASTSDYTAVPGCMLPSTFSAGCYHEDGAHIITMVEMEAMNSSNYAKAARIDSLEATNQVLTVDKANVAGQLLNCQKNNFGDLATAIVIIVSVLLGLMVCMLSILVKREKEGKPIFYTMNGAKV